MIFKLKKGTKPRFHNKVQSNSEMAYLLFVWGCALFSIFFEMKFELSADVVLGPALGMKELVMDR